MLWHCRMFWKCSDTGMFWKCSDTVGCFGNALTMWDVLEMLWHCGMFWKCSDTVGCFGNALTLWDALEMLWHCGLFLFSLYWYKSNKWLQVIVYNLYFLWCLNDIIPPDILLEYIIHCHLNYLQLILSYPYYITRWVGWYLVVFAVLLL
jgi:hypothetical protein